MTYREKFALLDKENKSPIEELFARYFMFQFLGDYFCEYDKQHISKERLLGEILYQHAVYIEDTDVDIINAYKKDDDILEFCLRIYMLAYNILRCRDDVEKLRQLFINASYEDYDYILRKQKRVKFRKNIKRKRGK